MKTKLSIILIMLLVALNGYSQHLVTLSGLITDSLSNTTVEGASIYIVSLAIGTVSNEKGQFLLYVPKGTHEVVVSRSGYETQKIQVEIEGDEYKEIALKAEPKKASPINRLLNKIAESSGNVIAQNGSKENSKVH